MVVLTDNNFIGCDNQCLKIEINHIITEFELQFIHKISILTTDAGPFDDDVALAIFVSDNVYIVKSQHPLYQKLLFDQIGKVLTLDYQAIISASTSCNHAEFIVYAK